MLISRSITDLNINQEEFKVIMDEKQDYDDPKKQVTDKKLNETLQV